jgi:hypothetical protein
VRLAGSRPALLAVAAVAGFLLSAIQVLPSAEFTRRSGRAATSVPRTLYELPGYLAGDQPSLDEPGARWSDGLTCRRIEPGTHHEHVYHFSVGPWRLAEYLWPNVSGRQFPMHRRWLDVIPAEGRIWVPSLYMGLVPLVLAIASMRFSRKGGRNAWLTWTVVLAVAASFGWYGLGWLVDEIRGALGGDMSKPWLVGGPFGGLYWLATVVLPGYVYFRYPAKLLVVAALGLSMLAAAGWDRAFGGPAVRLRRSLVWLTAISLAAAIATLAVRPFWDGWFSGMAASVMFGPFDAAGAWRDLFTAVLQTALVAAAFWWLLGAAEKRFGDCPNFRSAKMELSPSNWPSSAALALVAVDLAVANGWMVQCAPVELWEQERPLAVAIERHEETLASQGPATPDSRLPTPNSHAPYRVFRRRLWMPPSWRLTSSPDRLAEAARWDSATLWPKYNLAPGIPLAEVFGTMSPYDYEVFLAERGPVPFARKNGGAGPSAATTDKTGPDRFYYSNVRYFILRDDERLDDGVRLPLGPYDAGLEDVSLWYASGHLPRAWVVHDVEVLGSLRSLVPGEMRRQTDRVFSAGGRPRDLLRSALVETDEKSFPSPVPWTPAVSGALSVAPAGSERCVVTHYDPLRVQIDARLGRPGLVVLSDQFYSGWQLEVETNGGPARRVPIVRANRVMRGAWLPAGEHRLTYRYRPASFVCGAVITAIAWIGLAGLAAVAAGRSRDAHA